MNWLNPGSVSILYSFMTRELLSSRVVFKFLLLRQYSLNYSDVIPRLSLFSEYQVNIYIQGNYVT